MKIKKTHIASAIGLTLMGTGVANAALVTGVFGPYTWDTDRANLTMLTPLGGSQSGTNDVVMHWDGNAFNSITDYTGLTSVANVTASSNQPFASYLWTAHNIQVFTPGTYTFDTTIGGGNPEAGNLVLNVATGQLGMHMLVDWGHTDATNTCGAANCNIDVAVLTAPGINAGGTVPFFGSGLGVFENPVTCTISAVNANCLWNVGPASSFAGNTTANRPASTQAWMLTSIDGNGDGIPGIPMAAGGPLGSFNANFNANWTPTTVPVPAAAWLFGSGLLGLLSVVRRRKAA